jgi:hypothetical protein
MSCRVDRVVSNALSALPVYPGGLNRSTQHFILEGKDGVRPISQRLRSAMRAAEKAVLWDR